MINKQELKAPEQEILNLISKEGLTAIETTRLLSISASDFVIYYINILKKLKANTGGHAIYLAIKNGLIDLEK